jgi:uncharacterized protein (DUF302 family)
MNPVLGTECALSLPMDSAVEHVVAALKAEGFGILTRVEVDKVLHEKLGVVFRPYTILGACNPQLSHRALLLEAQVGLLLPCNVVVEETSDGGVLVRIGNPTTLFSVGGLEQTPGLRDVANEAGERLRRVASALRDIKGPE